MLKTNLSKDILDDWIDVPGYSGNLPAKEELIRTINNMQQNEVIIAFFDRSLNGKSGIVLSNFGIRIFSKGVFSNENEVYPIERLGKVSCLGNNKYSLEVIEENPIEINFNKRRLNSEGQILFCKALNTAITLIKNLLPKDREQMYRLMNTFAICKCGMHLLAEEKVCPSCKRMLKENGELVETEICANCKGIIAAGKKYCNICGSKLIVDSIQANGDSNEETDSDVRTMDLEKVKTQEQYTAKETVPNREYSYCMKCGNQVLFGKKFCTRCGNLVLVSGQAKNKSTTVEQRTVCPRCNNLIKTGRKFCSVCGIKI